MELVNRYDWHEDHSEHVAKLSLALFDEFQTNLKLSDIDRELLKYSAYMHDIGYFISNRKHHKHALYIIRHSDLLGFKEIEIEMMANISRYHRRSTPKMRHKYFKKLPKANRERIKKLSAILRVADGLDRSHYQNVRDVRVERSGQTVRLFIAAETEPQLEIWGAMRKRMLLEEVLSGDVEIVIDPDSPYPYR
jgi:exopolyphosphatase/guanosine-5'-triphosphate,3'-diphosphate pyrophosphatase